jgi:hypothetical protein
VIGGSLAYNWNTRKVAAGIHIIQAVAAGVIRRQRLYR